MHESELQMYNENSTVLYVVAGFMGDGFQASSSTKHSELSELNQESSFLREEWM